MAEQEKFYEVTAVDGLTVTDDKGKEHHLKAGRVVPRSAFGGTITWLVDGHYVKEVDPPAPERPAASSAATAPPPDSTDPDPDDGEAA